jgi:hypothetical protein
MTVAYDTLAEHLVMALFNGHIEGSVHYDEAQTMVDEVVEALTAYLSSAAVNEALRNSEDPQGSLIRLIETGLLGGVPGWPKLRPPPEPPAAYVGTARKGATSGRRRCPPTPT